MKFSKMYVSVFIIVLLSVITHTSFAQESGNAMRFDGVDDYVAISTGGDALSGTFTVEAWAKPNHATATMAIMGSRSPNDCGFDFKFKDGNTIHGDIGDGSNWLITTADAAFLYSVGQWYHIAYVVTTSGYSIYVNGVLKGSGSYSGTPLLFDVNHLLKLGNYGFGESYNGQLDEVRIWNVARTQQEIRENMHHSFEGLPSGLIGYWQFNEESGDAIDVINGYDGVLHGDAVRVSSSIPYGSGAVNTQTEAPGEVIFTDTNFSAFYNSQSGASVTVTRIDTLANIKPDSSFNAQYWVVNRFGGGTFNADMSFTVAEDLTAEDESDPSGIQLYIRSVNSDGYWIFLSSASSVDAASNTAIFENITTVGQFLLSRSRAPDKVSGNAMSFDGNGDYVSIALSPLYNIQRGTIEMWVKWTGTQNAGTNGYGHVLSRSREYYYSNQVIGLDASDPAAAKVQWYPYSDSPVLTGSTVVGDGEWNHIAITYQFGEHKLYVNGNIDGTSSALGIFDDDPTSPTILGAWLAGGPSYSACQIDEFRVWNGICTATEIRENMHHPLTGSETELREWWQFNEESGVAIDMINGHNGVLYGDAVRVSSSIPYGSGAVNTQIEAAGEVIFTDTDFSAYYNSQSGASVTVTRIDTLPNTEPVSALSAQYWVVNRFGGGTFEADMSFTVSEDLTPEDESDPSGIRLYTRSVNSDDDWILFCSASSVDATNNTAVFDGITAVGQFIITRRVIPEVDPEGDPGQSISFDGDADYISIDSPLLNNLQTGTIEMWVKWIDTQNAGTNGYGHVLSRQSNGVFTNQVIGLDASDPAAAKIEWYPYADTPVLTGSTVVGDGEWNHIAITYQNGEHKLYVNGNLDATSTATGTITDDNSIPVTLGAWIDGVASYPNCQIDEFHVWERILTPVEILENMHHPLTGSETDLRGLWQFNEDSGNPFDVINGYVGMLQGDAVRVSSPIPYGSGAVNTQVEATGEVIFTNIDFSAYYNSQSGASVTVTRIDTLPNNVPLGALSAQYWVVNRFGSGTFNADMSFTVSEDLTPEDESDPSGIQLYTRSVNSDDDWIFLSSANSVDATSNTAIFENITTIGQFLLSRSRVPEKVSGNAMSFDGADDYVAIDGLYYSQSGEIQEITLEAWVKTNDTDESIIASWDRSDYWRFSVNNGKVYWSTCGSSSGPHDMTGTTTLNDNTWHHLAVTYDNTTGTKRIYVDGVLDLETSGHNNGEGLGSGNIRYGFIGVGSEATEFNGGIGPENYFVGQIDEFRIWNVARTQQEIRENMHHPLEGLPSELIEYWQFNEETGDVIGITDEYNGTLHGDAVRVTSAIPYGDGAVNTQNEAAGEVIFTGTNFSAFYNSQSGASVTVTRIDTVPNRKPFETDEILDNQYWVLNRFDSGSFNANMSFMVSEDLTTEDEAEPGRIRLYNRPENSTGDWQWLTSASSVNAANNTAVFDSISSTGQFILIQLNSPSSDIGDFVWHDANEDGIQDSIEVGVGNVTVRLYNSSDVLQDTTTTDGDGKYYFRCVPDGDYYLEFSLPTIHFYGFSPQDQGGDDTRDSDVDPATGKTAVFTVGNDMLFTFDTGLKPNPAQVGDLVWNDIDMDGIQDDGEPGASDITAILFDSNDVSVDTTITDSVGNYRFTMVAVGDFYIEFIMDGGHVHPSPKDQGGDDTKDNDVNPTTRKTDLFTVGTDSILTIDAGLIPLFTEFPAGLPPIYNPWKSIVLAAEWGDYDNDDDLDLILAGYNGTEIFRNDDSTFTDMNVGFPTNHVNSAEWGDYDNDGDLDVLRTGLRSPAGPGAAKYSEIYNNNGGIFTVIDSTLPSYYQGDGAFGDYDNDGDLDVLLTGKRNNDTDSSIPQIAPNEGDGTFGDAFVFDNILTWGGAKIDWGDYDTDGDLDFCISFVINSYANNPRIYRNNSLPESDTPFTNVREFSHHHYIDCGWGDYDNDGDMDIVINNCIYKNDNGTFTDIQAGFSEIYYNNLAWGDYDNDGDLDLIMVGTEDQIYDDSMTRLYRNDGNDVFTEVQTGILDTRQGDINWGDYDNDGDLDLIVIGQHYDYGGGWYEYSKIYQNNTVTPNTPPQAPTDLSSVVGPDSVLFSWEPATDVETPSPGLTYNLRIGLTPGGIDICSPMSGSDGKRRIAYRGSQCHNTQWALKTDWSGRLQVPIYWSVQAVDHGFAGSPFAPENIAARYPTLINDDALAPNGFLTWETQSNFLDHISHYQIQIDDDPNFASPEVDDGVYFSRGDLTGFENLLGLEESREIPSFSRDSAKEVFRERENLRGASSRTLEGSQKQHTLELVPMLPRGNAITDAPASNKSKRMLERGNESGGGERDADIYAGIQLNQLPGYANLQDNTIYYWRMKPVYSDSMESVFTVEEKSFFFNKENSAPNAPTSGFTPAGDVAIGTLEPTIAWKASTDADSLSDHAVNLNYQLQVDDQDDFLSPVFTETTADNTTISDVTGLGDAMRYYYRIKTVDDEGLESVWSATQQFRTNTALTVYAQPTAPPSGGGTQDFMVYGGFAAQVRWGVGGSVPSDLELLLAPGEEYFTLPVGSETVQRYWSFDATGGSGWTAIVRLYYDDSELNGISEGSLQMWKTTNSGADWQQIPITARDLAENWVEGDLNSFSDFVLASGDTPLPVELTDFYAESVSEGIELHWTTESELDNAGFKVYRAAGDLPGFENLEGLIPGAGTSSESHDYTYLDTDVVTGKLYRYKISDINSETGVETFHPEIAVIAGKGMIDPNNSIPETFALHANYPNPFNPETTIEFDIPDLTGFKNLLGLTLKIYDASGKLVKTLIDEPMEPGYHSVVWDGKDDNGRAVSSGTYFCKMMTEEFSEVKQLVLLK